MSELISREKLIEELERIKHDFWYEDCLRPDYDCHREDDCTICAVERIREFIESQPPADQWIPCSERLPEDDTYVLVCSGEFVHEANFEAGHFSNEYGMWYKAIEYWMPLPEPYKGVE